MLKGTLRVEHEGGVLDVRAGQAIVTHPGEWVRYSTPESRRRRVRGGLRAGVLARHRSPRCLAWTRTSDLDLPDL